MRLARNKYCRRPEGRRFEKALVRFWMRVERRGPDDCWLWTGALTNNGYGVFTACGKQWVAHRFSCVVAHGDFPNSMDVRHLCESRYAPGDNTGRRCCNPAHLTPGTRLENMRDKMASGRIYGGDRHYKRLEAARKAG